MSLRRFLTRRLNPRYAYLPGAAAPQDRPFRILDIGAGPEDGRIAKELFSGCRIEAVNIAAPDAESRAAFDAYHQIDLNRSDLSFLPDSGFDYVISSHTIEHLQDGPRTVAQICAKVAPGGHIYLEWPSVESETFPIRGYGLNFHDDGTHIRTYPLAEIGNVLRDAGFAIDFAGRRRMWLRILISPLLVLRRSLQVRRLVLFDLWDLTGFAYVIRARRRENERT